MAVAAVASPMAIAKTITTTASVSPTAAMASGPRPATQKASTTPKVDSITISRMVGMASRAMPRVKLPCVKSCVVPPSASRRNRHVRRVGDGMVDCI